MALFVLGAGATRGASFVDPAQNPCLPPLDLDFYAQLQRIANLKHQDTVRDVIKDTVELFGVNFQVTMETVFTTLEHTARMIETNNGGDRIHQLKLLPLQVVREQASCIRREFEESAVELLCEFSTEWHERIE